MGPVEYVRKLRIVAGVSWLGSLGLLLFLAWLYIIPFNEFIPFIALVMGSIPVLIFMRRVKPICPLCGGEMKVSSGFPRIIYRCKRCQAEVNTGISSD